MKRKVLWVDCTAAVLAGAAVLLLSDWLSRIQALPVELLTFIGTSNLLYGSFSFFLATRSDRPKAMIVILVAANGAWAALCLWLAFSFSGSATVWGLGHLIGEAFFVGGLAALEWRWRAMLTVQADVRKGRRAAA